MDLVTTAQLLGNFGEFVGAIAVVGTLFYLALQVRQGRNATEANTHSLDQSRKVAMAQILQTRVRTNLEIAKWLAESDYLLKANREVQDAGAEADLLEALNALHPDDRTRYVLYLRVAQWHMDSLYQLHEAGLLDHETYNASFSGIEGPIRSWLALDDAGMAQPLRPSFRREIESKLASTSSNERLSGLMNIDPFRPA